MVNKDGSLNREAAATTRAEPKRDLKLKTAANAEWTNLKTI